MLTLPRYIALCGQPGHGKTTVQNLLFDRFEVEPIDDGQVLREATAALTGADLDDLQTQEGKTGLFTICGQELQRRDFLGWLGNCMEGRFGTGFMPEQAMRIAEEAAGEALALYGHRVVAFSFGSVRKDQGRHYKARGGAVIEVVDPRKPTSPYDFDQYDRSLVDFTILNDGDLDDLERSVVAAIHALGRKAVQEAA